MALAQCPLARSQAMIPPSDAGARREMERMVWAAAFARSYADLYMALVPDRATEAATADADRVAAAYREHGPTR